MGYLSTHPILKAPVELIMRFLPVANTPKYEQIRVFLGILFVAKTPKPALGIPDFFIVKGILS